MIRINSSVSKSRKSRNLWNKTVDFTKNIKKIPGNPYKNLKTKKCQVRLRKTGGDISNRLSRDTVDVDALSTSPSKSFFNLQIPKAPSRKISNAIEIFESDSEANKNAPLIETPPTDINKFYRGKSDPQQFYPHIRKRWESMTLWRSKFSAKDKAGLSIDQGILKI